MTYEIKKNIPAPGETRGRAKYPFKSMEVGDCFDVPMGDRQKNQIQTAATGAAKRYGMKARSLHLKDENIVRVWRIA